MTWLRIIRVIRIFVISVIKNYIVTFFRITTMSALQIFQQRLDHCLCGRLDPGGER